MAMPPRPMPPMGGAPNTPPMGGPPMGMPPTGGAVPPPVNPPVNRLDSLMNTAGPVTGMGGPPSMPEDPMMGADPMQEEMETVAAGIEPQEIVEGFASSVMELTNGSVEGAVSLLQSTIDTLLSSQTEDPEMSQDAGRIEEMLAGLV